jgi:hypothetical protein
MSEQAVVNALMRQGGIASWLNKDGGFTDSRVEGQGVKESIGGAGGGGRDWWIVLATPSNPF